MTPYYQDDWATIYHGDCREVLPTLADASTDLVLTDVPCNEVNRLGGGLRLLDRGSADSAPVDVDWVARETWRLCSGSAYVFCATEQLSPLRATFVDLGMSTRACVWHKTNPSPMNGEVMWLSALELCVFARKPKSYFSLHCKPPIWVGPTEPRDDHPTAKPDWLFRSLITASAPPTGMVLDPFMGSGTTLRAAKDLGRKSSGVEIEEQYCEIAAKRLAQEVIDFGSVA